MAPMPVCIIGLVHTLRNKVGNQYIRMLFDINTSAKNGSLLCTSRDSLN